MPQLLAGDGAFIDGDCPDGLNEWFDRAPRQRGIPDGHAPPARAGQSGLSIARRM